MRKAYGLLLAILTLADCSNDEATTGLTEGHFLACAVEKTDLEQFPGQIAILKTINSPRVKQWLDYYTVTRNPGPFGLGADSVPKYYNIPEVLQMIQNEGINVSELPDVGLPPEIIAVFGQR